MRRYIDASDSMICFVVSECDNASHNVKEERKALGIASCLGPERWFVEQHCQCLNEFRYQKYPYACLLVFCPL